MAKQPKAPPRPGWALLGGCVRTWWRGLAAGVVMGLCWTVARVSVPKLTGKDEDAARSLLSAAGLNAQVQTSAGGTPGRVKAQNPAGGTRVDAGSTVTITLGAAATTSSTSPPNGI